MFGLKKYYWFWMIAFLVISNLTFSQGRDKTIQFVARIVSENNMDFLPSAYVFNKNAGRGGISDNFGLVELYVFPGDTIEFSYVGYEKQKYVVKNDKELVQSALIRLKEKSTMLQEVTVFRHQNLEEFKKAILNMELPDAEDRANMARNLEQSKLSNLAIQAGQSSNFNYKNFSDNMIFSQTNKTFYNNALFGLTNPFAWGNFLKSIKNGDLKRQENRDAYFTLPRESVTTGDYLKELKTR